MPNMRGLVMGGILALVAGGVVLLVRSTASDKQYAPPPATPPDAIAEAQTPKEVPAERPEQKKTDHDLSDIFAPDKAASPPRRPWPTKPIRVGFSGSTSTRILSAR